MNSGRSRLRRLVLLAMAATACDRTPETSAPASASGVPPAPPSGMSPPSVAKQDAAAALRRAEQAAVAAHSPAELSRAIEPLLAALADERLGLDDRVGGLATLAGAYRRRGSWPEAERAATRAMALADTTKDPRTKARAKLEFGTTMLLAVEEHHPVETPDPALAALTTLDAAAKLYESQGSVDFYATLLAIARALELAGDDTRQMYARITRELVQEKWIAAARASPELARHVDYLRGRAFFGLGSAELARKNRAHAVEHFDAARELLTASQAYDVASFVERMDELLERPR